MQFLHCSESTRIITLVAEVITPVQLSCELIQNFPQESTLNELQIYVTNKVLINKCVFTSQNLANKFQLVRSFLPAYFSEKVYKCNNLTFSACLLFMCLSAFQRRTRSDFFFSYRLITMLIWRYYPRTPYFLAVLIQET